MPGLLKHNLLGLLQKRLRLLQPVLFLQGCTEPEMKALKRQRKSYK
jgi:hypothetical protein